ncbi:DUF2062 domain-containing protein [Synechococcus sp. W4D4]|uniref:DUF2062 domain-containing protein n=1 Tax=Synechococcus sp. W4D4 TaxID=3392294 RepID=UPI0039EB8C15
MRGPKGWLQRLRQWLLWLWHHEATRGQKARGLAAGVFMGCFPIFGLQTLLGIALASLVRGNHILAAAGTWISNPLTYIPLYWFNYAVGCRVMGPGPALPSLEALQQGAIWEMGVAISSRLLLGSTLVGLASAALFGGLYWCLLTRNKRGSAHT